MDLQGRNNKRCQISTTGFTLNGAEEFILREIEGFMLRGERFLETLSQQHKLREATIEQGPDRKLFQ